MQYQVSIIIPIYNVEDYIRESFTSALNQSFESIEYILIDDCGEDNSMSIVAKMIAQHTRKKDIFIYKHEHNQGLSAARNTGISKATGKYIYFMDSDDEITIDCIEKHFGLINKEQSQFTVANVILVGSKSQHISDVFSGLDEDPLSSFFQMKWNVMACNKLYLRSFLINNNLRFKEGLLHEDILWSYNLSLRAEKISSVEDRTYKYKIRQGSITTKKNNSRKIDSLIFILNNISDDWSSGVIQKKYFKDLCSFMEFYKLTTALQLLNYEGGFSERRSYFDSIKKVLNSSTQISMKSIVLKLPFELFFLLLSPIYYIYKQKK